MSRPLLLALSLCTSVGCLGYRSQEPPRAAHRQQAAAGAGQPSTAAPSAPAPSTAAPSPAAAMLGAAWTMFGMLLPGAPAPAPPSPAPPAPQPSPGTPAPQLSWPFPLPLPVMTGAPPVPSAPGPLPTPSGGDAPAAGTGFEDEVLALTNRRRAAGATCGAEAYPPAPPLTEDVRLRQAARAHAADMGARDYFDHQTPEGRTAVDRARAAGYPSAFVGENIAAGYSTPEAVVAGWMKSPGHCTNIMDPRYTRLGVGYASRPASSMRDYWVQDFGH